MSSSISMMVTSQPSCAAMHANSHPITPPPRTRREEGSSVSVRKIRLSMILGLGGIKEGIAETDPDAMMIFGADILVVSLPFFTARVDLSMKDAVPSRTLTPLLLRSIPTPPLSLATMSSLRSIIVL